MSIADELITRGWGRILHEAPDGAVCLRGAAMYATTGMHYTQFVERKASMDKLRAYLNACTVLDELVDYRGGVGLWNDARGRTFDEVLRVAKEADEILGATR